jgi:hypothetical protein
MNETFTKSDNVFGITSSYGYSVCKKGNSIPSQFIEYIENDHKYIYHLDYLIPGATQIIHLNNISKWEPPFDKEIINNDKKIIICNRIENCMKLLGDKNIEFSERQYGHF